MGLIAECDGGCGATTDDVGKFTEFGIVRKVYYCEKCAEQLKHTYAARDSLHTKYVENLTNALLLEIASFRRALPRGRLPDAPE